MSLAHAQLHGEDSRAVKRTHLFRFSLCNLPLWQAKRLCAHSCFPGVFHSGRLQNQGLGAIPCLARSRSLRHVHVPSAFLLALLILPQLRAASAHTAAGRAPRVVGAFDSCGSSASERASSGDGALVLPDSSGNNLEDPWCGDDHADDDPDEPYLQDWPEMPISPTTYLDSDDSSYFVFNADWSIARRQIRAYLEKQEAEQIARRSAAASMAAEESRRIPHNVAFTVSAAHMRHRPGCRVVVCGGHSTLGQWRPSQGLVLHTTPETFPLFTRSVYIEAPARLEYRYALVVGDAVHPTADSADDLPSSEADCDASSGADGSSERRGADVDGPSLESNEAGLEVHWEAKSRLLVVPECEGGRGGRAGRGAIRHVCGGPAIVSAAVGAELLDVCAGLFRVQGSGLFFVCMHVCVCVYVCVCVHACMVYMQVCLYVCMSVCLYVCM